MKHWPVRASFVAGLALLAPAAAHADETALCNGLKQAVSQARADFTATTGGATSVAAPERLTGASMCSMAKDMSGANSFHCAWDFPFRDAASQAAFKDFNELLGTCFGARLDAAADSGVNHPDFFDLREYQIDQVKVTISIKDKSQLGKTLVFVGVHGVAPQ